MISIIVPIYNSENYLTNCLDSICNQTYQKLEIILVNDGSTDSSASICEKYAKKDSRIVVINKKNEGVSSARNEGIKTAKGEYVVFIDSDDYMECNCIEVLYETMIREAVDFVACGCKRVVNNCIKDFSIPCFTTDKSEQIVSFYMNHCFTHYINTPWAKLYKKSHIHILFDVDISLGEDTLFNINYLSKLEKIAIIPDCLYNYRLNESGTLISSYKDGYYDGIRKVYLAGISYVGSSKNEDVCTQNISYKFYNLAIAFIVKQYLNKQFDSYYRKKYIERILNDDVFLQAISDLQVTNIKDKIIVWAVKKRLSILILFFGKIRAEYKKYNRKKNKYLHGN